MSLATRCPACHTTFRVVQDQLKASEGWVRCGRCDEAFNAIEGLFDLERDSGMADLDDSFPSSARGIRATAATEPMPLDELPDRRAHAPELQVATAVATTAAPDKLTSTPRNDEPATEAPSDMGPVDSALIGGDVEPEFLRKAQRQAFWRRPAVRLGLSVMCLLLAGALLLQWVVHQRDTLAAQRPDWAPALRTVCKHLGCEVQTLRSLQAIVVDSSGLEATDNPTQFRFQAVLRNAAAVSVATPALDLMLTDARGQLVARRTLMPSDFGAETPQAIAPNAELPLLALLDLSPLAVTGYTVLAYYP
jgi:predicted Zn finger-like uncharacterized protein